MTPEQLNAIEERANAATPGPWQSHESGGNGERACVESLGLMSVEVFDSRDHRSDADFIANARQDIPALINRVRELLEDENLEVLLPRDLLDDIPTLGGWVSQKLKDHGRVTFSIQKDSTDE